MNNDIKEIKIIKSNHSIVIIKNGVIVKEQFAIDDEILDYITNLQEENEKNNIQANYFMNRSDDLEEIIDDYKSRIDKAVEFLNNDYNYKKGDRKFNRTDYVI